MAMQAADRDLAISVPENPAMSGRSYVDWGAIFAGAVLAAAVSFVLLTFGSAIGLALVSPYRGESASLPWFVITAALWMLWVQLSSFLAGGYVAGRLRHRVNDATEHEVHVRDGAHGLLVWATGLLVAAFFAGLVAVGGLAGATSDAGKSVAAEALSDARSGNSLGFTMDALLRSDRGAPRIDPETRADVTRIIARGAVGDDVTEAERNYAARVVARETSLNDDEARQRVDASIAEAKKNADRARKLGILLAFITAASLAVSAAAAVWAARRGGHHRDRNVVFDFIFTRRLV